MLERNQTKIGYSLCLALGLASALLAFIYYKNVLLLQDGGWYSYPAYALLMGGDPSENLPGHTITSPHPGVTAKFMWENRTNLFVLHQLIGIKSFGPDWAGIRIYGGLHWILLAAIGGLITKRLTKSNIAGGILTCFILADSVIIGSAISNARPDVIIALLGLIIFGLTEWTIRTESTLAFLLTCAAAVALSLMHVTSAIGIALICSYIGFTLISQIQDARRIQRRSIFLGIIATTLCLTYLLRLHILDLIIPTQVPANVEHIGQHSLIDKLKGNFGDGLHGKLLMERTRWYNYFFIKNFGHLVLLIAGFSTFVLIRNKQTESLRLAKRLGGAVLFASFFQLIADPHGTSSHLIVLMVLGYIAALICLHEWLTITPKSRQMGITLIALMLVASICLKLGQCYKIEKSYGAIGFTNAKVAHSLSSIIKPVDEKSVTKIIGPTELWPYFPMDSAKRITIIDHDRTKLPKSIHDVFDDGVAWLVINEDYWDSGWGPIVQQWLSDGIIFPTVQFGKCGVTAACLSVYQKASN